MIGQMLFYADVMAQLRKMELAAESRARERWDVGQSALVRKWLKGDEPATLKFQDRMATIDAAYRRVMARRGK